MSKERKGLPLVTYQAVEDVERDISRPSYLEEKLEMLTGENIMVKSFIQKYMHEMQTPEQAAIAMVMLYDILEKALKASRQVKVKILNDREAAEKIFEMAEKAPDDYDLN